MRFIVAVVLVLAMSTTNAPALEVSRPIAKLNTQATEIQANPHQEVQKAIPIIVQAESKPVATTGDCDSWIDQAGVTDKVNAKILIMRESGCNPSVYNSGGSGAGGIPQALPASKMGCAMNASGAVCQIRWMQGYVFARYGSWANAVAHSNSVGWY